MQWRQPPDRDARLHGDLVEFGRGRSRGRGYLAHSDRAGPGVLLLEPSGQPRADAFCAAGFTVLVPEYPPGETPERMIAAAAQYLSANWHPRLGVVAFGERGAASVRSLLRGGTSFDALVLYDALWVGEPIPEMPVVAHMSEVLGSNVSARFEGDLLAGGSEPELFVYPSGVRFAENESLADARTLDALEYLLS
jgi:hypothetical protein